MTKIKICGIKTLSDALAAIEAGADMLGFNFYPKSPRYLTPEACAEIISQLPPSPAGRGAGGEGKIVTLVGVLVNSSADEIRAILETAHLHLAQLHGDEPPELLAELQPHAFKAIRLPSSVSVRDSATESVAQSASIRESATKSADQPTLLLDSSAPGLYGGSGLTTDWDAAAQIASQYPILLAGGLTPENVAEAIARVQPWGVDVASGVEAIPGVKDPDKMKAFVKAVRDTR
jgi:phosphoribosylanthranilate isomerase